MELKDFTIVKKLLIFFNENILRLELLNIIAFLIGLFSIQILLLIKGYSRFVFVSFESILSYEQGLYLTLLKNIGPFAFIISIIALWINIDLLFIIVKRKRIWGEYFILHLLNLLFVLVGLLKLFSSIFRMMTPSGVLG